MKLYDGVLQGTALVRCDFNIPLNGSNLSKIEDIKDTLNLLKHNKVILMTHLGNISEYDSRYSVSHIKPFIEECLNTEIEFCPTLEQATHSRSRIILLENLRFFHGEKSNDHAFAQSLAALGDFYINDAFACSHRQHASLSAIRQYISRCYLGVNIYKQITKLTPLLGRKYIWIVGGVKVQTKLNNIPRNADVIIGGAIANSYFQYQGFNIGKSVAEAYEMDCCNFIPPIDIVTNIRTIDHIDNIRYNEQIIDVGPKTIEAWIRYIAGRPCIWNGAISLNEKSPHQLQLLDAIAEHCPISIIGGGNMYVPNKERFTHVSTGGGALLYFMSHNTFPDIEITTS